MRKFGVGAWGCAGVLAIVAAAGCAEESKKPAGEPASADGEPVEATEPGTPVSESPEAVRTVARLRERKVNDPAAKAIAAHGTKVLGAAGSREPTARAVIGASHVERFERTGGLLRPVLRKEAGAPRANVALPETAEKPFRLSDVAGKMKVDVALRGASPKAQAEVADGVVVYRNALDGAAVLHRVTADGTEDFVELERAPASPDVRYDMRIDKSVAGLRLVGQTLEMLDANGTPRLRVTPPYLVDADGTHHAAKLDVEDCAVDTSSQVPWGRAVVAPGKDVCVVHVSWADVAGDVKYPAILDPGWTTTASMARARYWHRLVTLANGRALAVGGHEYGSVDAPEIYDPATRTWSGTGAAALTQHYAATATMLDNGNVLVAGGYGYTTQFGYRPEARAEIYEAATNTWREIVPMRDARYIHTATKLPNGRVLVTGGYSPSGYLAAAELFDPATESWTPTQPMSLPRGEHVATAFGRKVLVTGGFAPNGPTALAEVYDTDTGAWTVAPAMLRPRLDHFAALLPNGKILAGGGYANSGPEASVEVYTPGVGWTATKPLNQSAYLATATVLRSGEVLVAGGYGCPVGQPCTTTAATELYRFDAAGSSWTNAGTLATSRYVHAATLLGDGNLLVSGGYSYAANGGAISPLASAEVYVAQLAAPVVTLPHPNDVSFARTVPVSGSGVAGAIVKVFDGATPPADGSGALASLTVDASGHFDGTVTVPPGVHTLSFTQTASGSTSDPAKVDGVVIDLPPAVEIASPPPVACLLPGSTKSVSLAAHVTRDPADPPTSLSYAWSEGGQPLASGAAPTIALAIGSHTIHLHVTDGYGAAADTDVSVALAGDTEAPVVTAPAPVVRECSPDTTYVAETATANDACDGALTATASPASVPGNSLGVTAITYTAQDRAGLSGASQSTIQIIDSTPPAFHPPPSLALECKAGGSFPVAPVPASDVCDGSATALPSRASIPLEVGRTRVIFSATDASGNSSSGATDYDVRDGMPPQLALSGPATAALECGGAPWQDPGARAIDVCVGDLTSSIRTSGAVDTHTVGTYVLGYTVTDPSGNTDAATRSVIVQDTTPPSLALIGPPAQTLECGASRYTEAGASAVDQCSGDLSSAVHIAGSVDTAAVASYDVAYSVSDPAGNRAEAHRSISVVDTTPPELTLAGSQREVLECGQRFLDPGATARDVCVGDLSSSIAASGVVDGAHVGTYGVRYEVADASHNSAVTSRTVDVRDTTPPVVSLAGAPSMRLECGGAPFSDPGASANDVCVGDIAAPASGSVDARTVGRYVLTYTATDPSGNRASATRSVSVEDAVPPVLTMNGSATQTLECGVATYTETGATARDACTGDLSSSISTTGSVDTRAVASYSILYSVADASGNKADAHRSISVTDTTAPKLTLAGASTEVLECGQTYVDPGATARDVCVGDVSSRISRSGSVDGAHVGTYPLRYEVADPSGNSSSASRSVDVKDTTAPTISIVGAVSQRLECGTAFSDPGARALDICSGDIPASVSGTVDARTVGRYVVTYSASDPSGNRASAMRNVSVEDALAPQLSLVGPSTVTLECGGSAYVEPGATATDQCAGSLTAAIVETGLPINNASVGSTTLGYSVRDPSGNTASASRSVVVRDTLPPTVTLKPSFSMWPPNSAYTTFSLADVCVAAITDQCGGPTTARIDSIYSDEGLLASNDIVIQSNTSFMVRSARDGKGNGRVYGITFTVRDAAGNGQQSLCRIFVPHDQTATTSTDSGAAYTVTNTY
jgi:hypothetical protein